MQSQVNRDDRHSLIENILFHSPDGVRAVELAERCGVDRRTIYRDLSRLRKNGIPIYQKQGRFFVSREYYHAPVQLTLNETVALFTAVRVLSQVANQHNPHVI
ncbi:MAG: HTH domain-containing protein, partial [Chloroflexota bacterium]